MMPRRTNVHRIYWCAAAPTTTAQVGRRAGNGISVWTRLVTVHDYITTMHPWLMRNRDDILDAMDRFEDLPDPEDMDLVVDLVTPNRFTIKEKSEWVSGPEHAGPELGEYSRS